MTEIEIVEGLVAKAPRLIAGWTSSAARCIAATAIGIRVLAEFSIRADPMSVSVRVLNEACVRWLASGRKGDPKLLGCYDLRVATDTDPVGRDTWNGHLVVYVPLLSTIIDLDLQQMSRPARGIVLPEAASLDWKDTDGHHEYRTPDGSLIAYGHRRIDRSWQSTSDWLLRQTPRFDSAVAEIVREIRRT